VLKQLGLSEVDQIILRGYWIDRKTRKDIAKEINYQPNSIIKRYIKLINHIRERLQNLVIEFNYYKQRVEELEQVKQEYINFHLKKTGKYPKFMLKDDLIEHVSMSQRLHNCLSQRGLKRMRNLSSYTQRDILNSRNFGKEALNELENIMIKYKICFKEN